jgi:putative DNA primase/helicase
MLALGFSKAETIEQLKRDAEKHGIDLTDAQAEDYYKRAPVPEIALQSYSKIEPKSPEWLWKDRIPCRALTIHAGDPGVGKSMGAIDLAARVSRGSPWPDGSGNAPLGDVIILSSEDDHEMTIRPRLDAAGADVAHVHRLCASTRSKDGKRMERTFNLEEDVKQLRLLLYDVPDTKLIIVDPISSYLGKINDSKELEVRQALGPLIALAAENGIPVVGIKHFNKDSEKAAIYRPGGSIGYVAVARAASIFVKDPKNESRSLMLMIKSNLGPKPDGLAYRLVKGDRDLAAHIEWLGLVGTDADEALSSAPGPKGERLDEAKQFLRLVLKDGSEPVKEIQRQARAAGIQWRTVWRAKEELGVRAEKKGFGADGEWLWMLNDDAFSSPL